MQKDQNNDPKYRDLYSLTLDTGKKLDFVSDTIISIPDHIH